ncbi:MAG TPA: hypothetical protein EYF94_07800, partial [Porticoccaceae bacterium]|nr:hypothetical protein [Porticoccaceae bacterium]
MKFKIIQFSHSIGAMMKLLLSVVILLACQLSIAQNPAQGDNEDLARHGLAPVGSVSLVIGRAFVESDTKGRERLSTGAFVREGDSIQTESSGHVHIRFSDNAVLSVRPSSVLQIETYRFDENNPENSTIKLNLIQGTARTVSGEGARAARHRFRLNTPIAAIGVRGTDFVVSSTSSSLTALVNDGAIVVAPFSSQCAQSGVGPCAFNGVELDAGSLQIIEFDSSMSLPRLVPLLARDQDAEQYQNLVSDLVARSQASVDDSSQLSASPASADDGDSGVTVKELVTKSVTSFSLEDEAKDQAPYSTGFTPGKQQTPSELRQRQLVWGRYAEGKGNLERLTLPLSDAANGRRATIGGNYEYYLFRPEGIQGEVQKGLGEIGFSLSSAQAYFKREGEISPV